MLSIRGRARKRFTLGYPPRKDDDNSIGDAINWEWIIHCAQEAEGRPDVLIVSRDSDFGMLCGTEAVLNDWLKREFQGRISKKRKIELTNKLTLALEKLDERVPPADIEQEEKLIQEDSRWLETAMAAFATPPDPQLQQKLEQIVAALGIQRATDGGSA